MSLFFLYDPKSKLFFKRDGVTKYWSVSDHAQRASGLLTPNVLEAYSARCKKEAQTFLNTIVNDCGYVANGVPSPKVELDEFLGCKVDNTAACVIINAKNLTVQEVNVSYSFV